MRLLVGGWLLLLGASCDSRGAAVDISSAEQALQSTAFGAADALDRHAHEGVRLVEFFEPDGARLAYRERIATDGHGRFAIDSVKLVVGSGQDPELFALLQESSQGFLFRYRDFAIRSSERFDRNYTWVDRDESREVAGRACRVIDVSGTRAGRGSYVLALDGETGIVLASEERDAAGRLVHAVTYESFDPDPDLSAVAWHVPANRERQLDRNTSLSEQLGIEVLEPRLLPPAYAWIEASTVHDDQREWLKTTYTDGVHAVLFLQRLDLSGKDAVEASGLPAQPEGDRITVYSMGAVTVLQGRIAGRDVIALGRVPEAELLDLIESALP